MANKRQKVAKFQGVYFRESESRTYKGKPDRCFDISYKDQNGKKIWEKVGWLSEGYSAQFAAGIRANRLQTLRHGEELPKKHVHEITFGEVWKKYDQWLQSNHKQPRDDRGRYHKHLEPRFANKPLSKITPFDLERLKSDLKKSDLADATVKHVIVVVRQMFNKAIAWGLWSGDNPVKKVKIPQLQNRRERFLTYEEATTLLDEMGKSSEQLRDMASLSLYTGLRAGEIFALRWSHIDLENDLIHVADPKGGSARKAFIVPQIKEIFKRQEKPSNPEQFVFLSRKGEQIVEVSNAFGRVVNRLGLNDGFDDRRQKVTFHTLRHTFASWLALRGTPIFTIKELMGHHTLVMTERYAHLLPDHKREAANALAKEIEEKLSSAENGSSDQANIS